MTDDKIVLGTKKVLTLAAAKLALAAGEREAAASDGRFSIAVIDDGGHLLSFARMDGIHIGTADVAIAKARSAALFKRPSKAFSDAMANMGPALLSLPGVLPLEGGVPIVVDGAVIGAVGVSGGTPDADGRIATAAVAAITASLA